MFSAFKKSLAQVSIFHNPASPPSTKALALLRAAASSPYPAGSSKPLKFNLEVIESPPTADQVRTLITYLPAARGVEDQEDPHHISKLISSHPSAPSLPERPHSAEGLVRLAQRNPNAVKWPIVVDWSSGNASVGDVDGVKEILEHLRKKRDGEVKDEEGYKPSGWFS
ncbi:hypothetical protein FA95DRAFT_1603212 [Auriscalpium vulgare]|uniref:Uncharacterized protein n=1 Tax=Auriscalpium vulgare TaxID=40419 RepID=A0ACB8S3A4_9AGAM|nr:hypothetical protein FA95DRAFT_1603212 [Auriscalpium vulgare]